MVWSNFPSVLGTPPRRAQWDPWRELSLLQDEVTRFLGDRQRGAPRAEVRSSFPPVRIVTDSEGARLVALVPGLTPDEISVTVEGDLVRLEGARRPELAEGEQMVRAERVAGEFSRSFRLPFEVDAAAVTARQIQGVLEVELPRTAEQRPRKIDVVRAS